MGAREHSSQKQSGGIMKLKLISIKIKKEWSYTSIIHTSLDFTLTDWLYMNR
jgi:hypothetical protein